ncbi:MAG: hypothetical protein ACRCX2_36085 [Paraclostridium sp.]
MGLEYCYLFGLDINLDKYGLGTIKQPVLKNYIVQNVNIEMFYIPFIYVNMIIDKSENSDDVRKIVNKLGTFNFLIKTCLESKNISVLIAIQESLKFLYRTDNIRFGENANIIINDEIFINNDNFDILSTIIFEMIKIDKSKIKFDKDKKELSDIEKEFERRRKEHLERIGKAKNEDSLTILDLSNIVIHSGLFNYDEVLNMTIYQIKNSFEAITKKDSFDINMMHRVSPKFEVSKEKVEHWTEKIKIDKSSLSQID